jgi:hypothetical protein
MQYRFKGEPKLAVNMHMKFGRKKRIVELFTFNEDGFYVVEEGQFSADAMERLISTFSHETLETKAEEMPKAEEEPKKKRGRPSKKKEEVKDA